MALEIADIRARLAENSKPSLVGAIEAGGTKFVCAVGSGPDHILAETQFPTSSPEETLSEARDFFLGQAAKFGALSALGIGSFGPVEVYRCSTNWGRIAATPKPGWAGVDIAGYFREVFDLPIGFDTDVNGAVLGEALWGSAHDIDNAIYITIGTGIGGGVLTEGHLLHGRQHPEIGHALVAREPDDATFEGVCPYHAGACLEGLASGPAIGARWSDPAHELPVDHPAWDLEARYLATLCANLNLMFSPERIILGGGVMERPSLFPPIRQYVKDRLCGYLAELDDEGAMESLIVAPGLGRRAGICGAIALGLDAYHASNEGR